MRQCRTNNPLSDYAVGLPRLMEGVAEAIEVKTIGRGFGSEIRRRLAFVLLADDPRCSPVVLQGGRQMACFVSSQALLLGAAGLVASVTASHAGPCTAQIEAVQAQVDARSAAIAAAGPVARESTAARLHREPTPGSIARAEESLGEGASIERALSTLERAREADRVGNKGNCEQALAEARRAIGP